MRADATKATGTQARAEGSVTLASGDYSHAEGFTATASGLYGHAEGATTTASGMASHAEGGTTTASGVQSHAEGGTTTASGQYSHAEGRHALASRYGQHAKASGSFSGTAGDAQASRLVARRITTDATPTLATFDGNAATLTGASTNVLTLVADTACRFRVSVVARRSDVSGDTAGWEFNGLISRGSSGNAALVGTTLGSSWGAAGAAAWDVSLTIDTTDATNNYLKITVTGEAAKTIRWVACIETVEVVG